MKIDVKASSVVICDDIRRESSGKEILIGVYAGVILFPRLPAILTNLGMRIEFNTSLKSADDLTVELRDPDAQPLLSVTGAMEMVGKDEVQVLSVVCNNVEFTKEGVHTLFFGRKDWLEPAYRLPIRLYEFASKTQDT
jgi:hypothetical protein